MERFLGRPEKVVALLKMTQLPQLWKFNTDSLKQCKTLKLHLSPCLNGYAMMRLHEMQVRMAPMLWWAIAGPPATTITQVISYAVRVSTVIIPARDRQKILSNRSYHLKEVDVSDGANLTSLFSCVSAGDSRHVLEE